MTDYDSVPEPDEPEPGVESEDVAGPLLPEPPHPINWNLLTADEAEAEWLELNKWVNWLRRTYGLPASVIPPFWHRHPELVWELSALHLYWLCAYGPEQNGSGDAGRTVVYHHGADINGIAHATIYFSHAVTIAGQGDGRGRCRGERRRKGFG